ncbi:MAG: natural resistance-associated macrophage protein-domain-containing protein [Piptocephalis tieghemiana]|nr:MAG: natural resistance-associated macrophage protein-domain-containing protein [Piptocephalis tieghemiana]
MSSQSPHAQGLLNNSSAPPSPSFPPHQPGRTSKLLHHLRRFLAFVGPGWMVSVGYMDPGNWATDMEAGARYRYSLLFVLLIANIMAILLQSLTVRLGVITGLDLAQASRVHFPRKLNLFLYFLCELAIIACDLAEVIGAAVAMQLLFGLPLWVGCLLTLLDVLIILGLLSLASRRFSRLNSSSPSDDSLLPTRILEGFVMFLVGGVAICFIILLGRVNAPTIPVLEGFLPSIEPISSAKGLWISLGIIGATVMPHNLYLHSHTVKARAFTHYYPPCESVKVCPSSSSSSSSSSREGIQWTIWLSLLDMLIALALAVFVNAAILIVSGAAFYGLDDAEAAGSADLFDAHFLLSKYLGQGAATVFSIALLLSGLSATVTATLAGQVVMEGFLGLGLKPWIRRFLSRGLAVIPATLIAATSGRQGLGDLLLWSQVILSLQLPFAVVPLVYLTSSSRIMKAAGQGSTTTTTTTPFDKANSGQNDDQDLLASDGEEEREEHTVPTGASSRSPLQRERRSNFVIEEENDGDDEDEVHSPPPPKHPLFPRPRLSLSISHGPKPSSPSWANPPWLTVMGWIVATIIVCLNLVLLVQMAMGND